MPEPDYNTSAVSSAPTSSPSPQSRPSGLGSRSGRNMDADMYAGSSYAPTSNAGTASATQTFSSSATSTGSFTGAASNKSDDGPGYGQSYNPAATLYSNTATALTSAGATLTPPTQSSYNPMNLYSTQSMAEISTEIKDYLRGTAIDDALREALEIPEVYQGAQSEEEPDPIVDTDVLKEALQPEPITVEELPDVIVEAGDTLTAIAEANNLPVQDVIDANPQIANPDMIRPGEKVKLTKRLDTKGETPERELPEVLSIPEAAAYMGKERATLIMKGIDKLFGLVPPKTDIEKKAKSELEYFLDAQPASSLPDFFKYVPDKVQLAEYMKGRAERKKSAGTMNFSDRSALTDMDNLQLVDIEDAQPAGLMSSRFDTKGGEVAGATTKAYDFLTKAGLNPPENQLLSEKLAVTGDQFTNREDALDFIDDSLDFEPTRKAAFSATVDAESSSGLLEGSNYTKQAAIATLGGGDANRIARIEALYGRSNRLSPEDQVTLFDIAYGGRMGNAPDEGHKYRGRGLIQITGKDNYRKYGEAIGMGDALVNDPDILLNNPTVMLAVTEAYLQDRLPERADGLSANDLKDAIGHSGDVPRGVTWRGTGSAYKGNQRWMDVVARLEEDGKQDEADEARLNNEFTAQQKVGAYIDGDIGPNSIRQMRSWLASKNVSVPADTDAREIVRLVNATN